MWAIALVYFGAAVIVFCAAGWLSEKLFLRGDEDAD